MTVVTECLLKQLLNHKETDMGEVKKLMELAFDGEISEEDEKILDRELERWLYQVAEEERQIGKLIRQVQ